jgi:hypothetical protein
MIRCEFAVPAGRLARRAVSMAVMAAAATTFGVVLGPRDALAQANRSFPATALRGEIAVAQPPELLLNGRPARLAPGARVRDENNLLTVTGSLAGRRLVVHYTIDLAGLVSEVWVLTPSERARQPWPVTPEQAAAWRFDPLAQTWTRP